MHSAWSILFQSSDFWHGVGKPGIKLRVACSEFRRDIPEDLFIYAVFSGVRIRKVDVFRLLPLTINDVIRLRSPLLFSDAFAIAVRRAGGFERCMQIVREKGWQLLCSVGNQRRRMRERLEGHFKAAGLLLLPQGGLYSAVITGRRFVEGAAVWRLKVARVASPRKSEYEDIMQALRQAVGFWYGGVNRDARSVEERIREARGSRANGVEVAEIHHQSISGKMFLYGILTFE